MKALRVMVVEDDSVLAELLGELLEKMGHDVCAIETTEAAAVATAVRCRPDLMIVDVRLDNGSGVSAVDKLHRTMSIPHLFIGGDISRVKTLRPDTIAIQKPFRESDLARAIQRVLGAATAG